MPSLIGPNIRFHHGKVNSKLPGSGTEVKWHQDFPFEPMTTDDMITCLLFIDDVTLENGPLEVIQEVTRAPCIRIGMMVCLPAPLTAALSTHSAIESPVAPAKPDPSALCTPISFTVRRRI